MILTHIAACSENHVIGVQGDLPWSLPEDMKFFRDTTKGHIMIMGRKTFDSFKGRTLPNRYHIVITRNPSKENLHSSEKSPVVFVSSLEEAIQQAQPLTAQWGEEVFIIGGGEIYKQSLPVANKIYLTLIHKEFPGDTYYPEIDDKVFTLINRRDVEVPIPFSFLTYLRK
ncbi:MAG: dihydrofolate reductase [Pseudobdellovibrionaceae bacterium]